MKKNNEEFVIHNIDNFLNGWFIGDFNPTLFKTNDFEIAIKNYIVGDFEESHLHMIATEYTVIITGNVEMNGKRFSKGQIIQINPGIATNFKALSDTVTLVVKIPSAKNDKFYTKC